MVFLSYLFLNKIILFQTAFISSTIHFAFYSIRKLWYLTMYQHVTSKFFLIFLKYRFFFIIIMSDTKHDFCQLKKYNELASTGSWNIFFQKMIDWLHFCLQHQFQWLLPPKLLVLCHLLSLNEAIGALVPIH